MGDFSEHLLFGTVFFLVFLYAVENFLYISPSKSILAFLLLLIGSVLPDIDHENAYVFRAARSFTSISLGVLAGYFAPFSLVLRFSAGILVLLAAYFGFSLFELRHRGYTHSMSFCFTLGSFGTFLGLFALGSPLPGLALAGGILSHLVLDGEFKLK